MLGDSQLLEGFSGKEFGLFGQGEIHSQLSMLKKSEIDSFNAGIKHSLQGLNSESLIEIINAVRDAYPLVDKKIRNKLESLPISSSTRSQVYPSELNSSSTVPVKITTDDSKQTKVAPIIGNFTGIQEEDQNKELLEQKYKLQTQKFTRVSDELKTLDEFFRAGSEMTKVDKPIKTLILKNIYNSHLERIGSLETVIQDLRRQLVQTREQLTETKEFKTVHITDPVSHKEELKKLSDKILLLENDQSQSNSRMQRFIVENTRNLTRIKEIEKQNSELTSEKLKLELSIDHLSTEFTNLQADSQNKQSIIDDYQTKLNTVQASNSIDQSSNARSIEQAELQQSKQDRQQLVFYLDSSKHSVKELEAQIAKMKTEAADFQAINSKYSTKIREYADKIASFQKTGQILEEQKVASNQIHFNLESELKMIQEQLALSESSLTDSKNLANKYQAEIHRKEEELRKSTEMLLDVRNTLKENEEDGKAEPLEIDTLSKEADKLRNTLQTSTQEIVGIRQELEQTKTKLIHAKEESELNALKSVSLQQQIDALSHGK